MDMWLCTIAIIAGQRVTGWLTDWLTWSCWSSTSLSIDYFHGWEWRWSVGLVWLALRWMIFLGAVASASFGHKTKARKSSSGSDGEMMNCILALGWPIDYYHHLQSPLHRSLFECRCVFPISHLASSFAPLSLSVAAVRMAGICVVNLLWYAEVRHRRLLF